MHSSYEISCRMLSNVAWRNSLWRRMFDRHDRSSIVRDGRSRYYRYDIQKENNGEARKTVNNRELDTRRHSNFDLNGMMLNILRASLNCTIHIYCEIFYHAILIESVQSIEEFRIKNAVILNNLDDENQISRQHWPIFTFIYAIDLLLTIIRIRTEFNKWNIFFYIAFFLL